MIAFLLRCGADPLLMNAIGWIPADKARSPEALALLKSGSLSLSLSLYLYHTVKLNFCLALFIDDDASASTESYGDIYLSYFGTEYDLALKLKDDLESQQLSVTMLKGS